MAKVVDMELKKAFVDMQMKTIETKDKINYIDSQINTLKRIMQQLDITQREINTFPSDIKTYELIGRMFLMTDLNDVKSNLKNRGDIVKERSTELISSKHYLEKNLKESEDNLREMVQLKKGTQEPKTN